MSSLERRKQREKEWNEEYERRQAEHWRKEQLSMYERIEEMKGGEDLKDILHRMAQHIGLEE